MPHGVDISPQTTIILNSLTLSLILSSAGPCMNMHIGGRPVKLVVGMSCKTSDPNLRGKYREQAEADADNLNSQVSISAGSDDTYVDFLMNHFKPYLHSCNKRSLNNYFSTNSIASSTCMPPLCLTAEPSSTINIQLFGIWQRCACSCRCPPGTGAIFFL